jgi:hypothetical protein
LTVDHEPETRRGVGGVPIEVPRFFQRHATVFIALVPIVIVVLRIARVSNFETTTARGVLESLGLVQIGAGTLLPLVPTHCSLVLWHYPCTRFASEPRWLVRAALQLHSLP